MLIFKAKIWQEVIVKLAWRALGQTKRRAECWHSSVTYCIFFNHFHNKEWWWEGKWPVIIFQCKRKAPWIDAISFSLYKKPYKQSKEGGWELLKFVITESWHCTGFSFLLERKHKQSFWWVFQRRETYQQHLIWWRHLSAKFMSTTSIVKSTFMHVTTFSLEIHGGEYLIFSGCHICRTLRGRCTWCCYIFKVIVIIFLYCFLMTTATITTTTATVHKAVWKAKGMKRWVSIPTEMPISDDNNNKKMQNTSQQP